MQTANTKTLRRIVRNILAGVGVDVVASWTDKFVGDTDKRRVAFMIAFAMSDEQQRRTEKLVKDTLTLAGYDNKVKVTDSTKRRTEQSIFCRDNNGVYLRMTAVLG